MTVVESASNAQAYSVSELAFALKRTLEDAYGFVRVRGEVSKVTRHASGHVYLSIKDERACIDGVVWKGQVRGLGCQPETGLEVIVTGKITTYPARSSYQLIVETMEPAGVGALLAQLERLKARMREEGLFEPGRKRRLPPSPAVIGVITSPTGAVIRDILHRIADRWPCRVMVWPVVVQGADAAAQVAAAIRGFDALDGRGALPRPDVLIVARGGGSIEDLWPFNDEALARTVAACRIPLISAVGHETDTTLIDYVSDRRAPTPTAAAEMATPVKAELTAQTLGLEQRLVRASRRLFDLKRSRLQLAARGLPRPDALLAIVSQRFDLAAGRLSAALGGNLSAHERTLERAAIHLRPSVLHRPIQAQAQRVAALADRLERSGRRLPMRAEAQARLPAVGVRLDAAVRRHLERATVRLDRADRLLATLHPEAPLARGFALVRGADGGLVRAAAALKPGDALQLKFADGAVGAHVDGPAPAVAESTRAPQKPSSRTITASDQGSLF